VTDPRTKDLRKLIEYLGQGDTSSSREQALALVAHLETELAGQRGAREHTDRPPHLTASVALASKVGGCCYCATRVKRVVLVRPRRQNGLLVRFCLTCFRELRRQGAALTLA